jgi:hypothetical protein
MTRWRRASQAVPSTGVAKETGTPAPATPTMPARTQGVRCRTAPVANDVGWLTPAPY